MMRPPKAPSERSLETSTCKPCLIQLRKHGTSSSTLPRPQLVYFEKSSTRLVSSCSSLSAASKGFASSSSMLPLIPAQCPGKVGIVAHLRKRTTWQAFLCRCRCCCSDGGFSCGRRMKMLTTLLMDRFTMIFTVGI